MVTCYESNPIIALRNEKGSYNEKMLQENGIKIIALRNEKGSYNLNEW